MREMKRIKTIKKFNISHNSINDEASKNVANLLSQNISLEELYLNCVGLHSVSAIRIMEGLKGISTLRKLYINDNNITDEAANSIAVVLSYNFSLQEFDISCNKILTAGITAILKGMKTTTMKRLNIRHCNVTDKATSDLAAVLSHNTKLEILDVSQNALQTKGAITIFQAMKKFSDLIEINISHNNISHCATDDIVAILCHNTKLQVLDLSYNIYIHAPLILHKMTPHISRLIKLSIRNNAISSKSTKIIANFLCCNCKLKEVDLSYNCLDAEGTREICSGLRNLSNLTKLDLSHNCITDKVANSIVPVLVNNDNLKLLCLANTNLSLSGITKVSNALQHIPLEVFDIRGNDISDQEATAVVDLLNDITKVLHN